MGWIACRLICCHALRMAWLTLSHARVTGPASLSCSHMMVRMAATSGNRAMARMILTVFTMGVLILSHTRAMPSPTLLNHLPTVLNPLTRPCHAFEMPDPTFLETPASQFHALPMPLATFWNTSPVVFNTSRPCLVVLSQCTVCTISIATMDMAAMMGCASMPLRAPLNARPNALTACDARPNISGSVRTTLTTPMNPAVILNAAMAPAMAMSVCTTSGPCCTVKSVIACTMPMSRFNIGDTVGMIACTCLAMFLPRASKPELKRLIALLIRLAPMLWMMSAMAF